YLVRRLLENTSQMGFIKLSHHDHKDKTALLAPPDISKPGESPKTTGSFINAGHADFSDVSVRERFISAITEISRGLPLNIPIVINQRHLFSEKKLIRTCPSDLSLEVAHVNLASVSHAEDAMKASMDAALAMRTLPLATRMQHLLSLANVLESERYNLSALMCLEVGKTWAEADADVAEAIDFCRYYAEMAGVEILPKKMGDIPSEHNILSYQGRGPSLIIAPWNFPLAIICGMSVAAYVSGNPIIMKPSEQSSATAYRLYQYMIKADFLKEAVQFLPGVGEELGPYLVAHRHTANICFTGSKKVGHEIMKLANTVFEGQVQMKRVICEMGGKNAIIVDDDADLDEAVFVILKSAFSYAGQKCSAASRLILLKTIKHQCLQRLINATKSIKMGSALDPSVFMGPVVDKEAFDRLNRTIKRLENDPQVFIHYLGEPLPKGYFLAPMILEVSDPRHWVMQEELFGPILAVYGADNLEQAVMIANDTSYALTGAFLSRSPKNIAYVLDRFLVGNLYINQKCTGAIVARQPFGGFKMSGTGIKAGGPGYLLNLVDLKVVSENTMRQGFTPEISC
ncbi:MAG TPA: aldehyde dehydrogenase family protein, partial [Myxococcota bacterium]|nr:aldehyde dehydrogenase family protein [Myxococcota bacterium]